MAVKQAVISKRIEQKQRELSELKEKREKINTDEQELESEVCEIETEEELEAVTEKTEELEQEKASVQEKIEGLENEISELERELEELNRKKTGTGTETGEKREAVKEVGSKNRIARNKYETRAQMLERLSLPEVRSFYQAIAEMVRGSKSVAGTRAVTDFDIVIPEVIVDLLQQRLGDYSALYNEVYVQELNGTGRVLLDGAIPEAIWVEMYESLSEVDIGFKGAELDGYKVAALTSVHNALIEDSMVNMSSHVESRSAMSVAKAVDRGILIGKRDQKQPTGVLTMLENYPDRIVTSDGSLKDIVSHMALIDDGEDGPPIGEVIAVMRRAFYYKNIAPQTFAYTSDGRLIVQNAHAPQLPDGTRIVFSQYAPPNTIILGDFKKYILGERKGMQFARSYDVKFREDQTMFRVTARYDGKPVFPECFACIKVETGEGASQVNP